MFFTEDELRMVVAWAVWRTSRSLGIISDDVEYAPVDAVAIISHSKGHREALTEFADAYCAWYQFHLEIYRQGKSGNLSSQETDELRQLIDRRDAARRALIDITPV
ncbi:hypothetical protein [Novosphingobium sp. Fuku2-ISO-50]|uniref:hypothetical protein n=1 Tax=Novosphingobium sp. Fuku2-ISO-50 TaxID=1739114 RepID=UPI000A930CA4|nr:hypothetical protein [Novosphingobium sp. Fuku2-ISO-50]